MKISLELAAGSPVPVHCGHEELVRIEELKPHPENPNTHPQRQIDIFRKILRYNGIRRPITVSRRSGFITKGHGLLETLKEMGASRAPVEYQDYLNEYEELADMSADNELARLSESDADKLKSLVVKLDNGAFDLEQTGMQLMAIETLLGVDGSKTLAPPELNPPSPAAPDLDGPPVFEPRLGGKAFAAPELPPDGPVSHVRMVQLYLSTETISEFMDIIEFMEKEFETKNATDTVFETLKWAYQAMREGADDSSSGSETAV